MTAMVNADFSKRVVVASDDLPWVPSPQSGVERRFLDRIGGEVARATSLVRYAPASQFTAHVHDLGEEFFVLDGTFADEHGAYPAGTYVRNPPGSRHTPKVSKGCIIFVKLRQMSTQESARTVVDTRKTAWLPGDVLGHERILLHKDDRERVTFERLAANVTLPEDNLPGGLEIFIRSGALSDQYGSYSAGTWLRYPPGMHTTLKGRTAALFWAKRGHLAINLGSVEAPSLRT